MIFTELTKEFLTALRPYYARCAYRLCEYSVGVKFMWRDYLHPAWAETAGCLVVKNTIQGTVQFDYPIAGEEGDEEAALREIESWCADHGVRPVISVVPREKASEMLLRYPRLELINQRPWQDYLYRAKNLAEFAGRKYSGQRNHIRKFFEAFPNAEFTELKPGDERLLRFWKEYEAEFQKDSAMARMELAQAETMFSMLDTGFFRAGALADGDRLLAVSLAEKCGETLVIHIEKALYSCPGAYPTMVQAFAQHFGGDCRLINREDDARDKGLRTSKLQYGPADMGEKFHFSVGTELDGLDQIPIIETPRLTLTALMEADKGTYNALCLDDERNRWWGYDYRDDLMGELTEDYFLDVTRHDFGIRQAVNWAVRLNDECIGEVVLYHPDFRGGFELGCRIMPKYDGHGYGTEAFAAAADWALYSLGLHKVIAKCFKENKASYKMLSSCMRPNGEDDKFYYFVKTV